MKAAVVFLLVSLCCGLASECGRRRGPRNTVFISKGRDALHNEFPWHVALKLKGGYTCAGSILNEEWIVTAAHCLKRKIRRVVVGSHDRTRVDEWQEERSISEIRIHPKYRAGRFRYDIALVKLSSPLDFEDNTRIGPICLPDADDDFTGEVCTASGWGRTSPEGNHAIILQKVDLPVLSSSECEEEMRSFESDSMICAGYSRGGGGACKGDSGGPLVCQREDNSWVLAGVTSWSYGPCGGYSAPNGFARVTAALEWIEEVMQDDE